MPRRCHCCTLCKNPCGVRVPERGAFQERFLPALRCEGQRGDGEAEMLLRAPSSRGKGRAAAGARRLRRAGLHVEAGLRKQNNKRSRKCHQLAGRKAHREQKASHRLLEGIREEDAKEKPNTASASTRRESPSCVLLPGGSASARGARRKAHKANKANVGNVHRQEREDEAAKPRVRRVLAHPLLPQPSRDREGGRCDTDF